MNVWDRPLAPRPWHGLYLCYVGSLDRVCIDSVDEFGLYCKRPLSYLAGANTTSISACGDTAVRAFEHRLTGNVYVRYVVTYNKGKTWASGTPIDTAATTEAPAVMLEKGQGIAIYYRYYGSGASREGRVIRRTYAFSATWAGPATISDYTPHYWKTGIAALGNNTWGVGYLSNYSLPVHRAALFAQSAPRDRCCDRSVRRAFGLCTVPEFPQSVQPFHGDHVWFAEGGAGESDGLRRFGAAGGRTGERRGAGGRAFHCVECHGGGIGRLLLSSAGRGKGGHNTDGIDEIVWKVAEPGRIRVRPCETANSCAWI
jgi:hypothetical protein